MSQDFFSESLYEEFSKKNHPLDSLSSPLYYIHQNSNEKNAYFTPDLSSSTTFCCASSPQYKYDSFDDLPTLRLNELKAVYIGRSSQSCTLSISRNNKFISRIHARIEYHLENKAIYITCLGWNGMLLHIHKEHEPRKIKKNQTSVVEWTPGIGPIIIEIAGSFSQILWPIFLETSVNNEKYTNKIYSSCTNNENIPPFPQEVHHHLEFDNKLERIPLKELAQDDLKNIQIYNSPRFTDSDSLQLISLNNNKIKIFPNDTQSLSLTLNNFDSKKSFIDSDLLDCVLAILAFSPLSAIPSSTFTHLFPSAFSKEDIEKWLRSVGQFVAEIKREGKDAAGKPLESEWYYIPESIIYNFSYTFILFNLEDDNEGRRARLQPFIKPIRQSRKIHKQYYWKKPKLLTSNNLTTFASLKKKNKKRKKIH
ncbi:uncharacterized protein T551_02782 [Pneumocystis jirovecii RU7]|uniref:FHA domain-containing protein n=1 Tax=Pneumocystis jirovecii (strain RU7) TaxID=1408657 RepID=A0A0W4ZHG9_PNEJ7|nr:uncharacterized protein T551_02782 [Pneumocystis jirovecii RU7]KTW27815.1 hypothetical protein T551_02782 [Pneumocystis jirovecii RU7]